MEGFKLVLTADGTQLQRSLKDTEDLLKRFKDAASKATNVESFNRLNRAIEATNQRLAILKGGSGGTGAVGATNALTNLNRVVQDAPFGIIGIANNIDPLINSFQGLSRASGGVGGALKALGSTLIGPAGILFAISAITSLATVATQKYGSLGEAFRVLTGQTKALTEEEKKYAEESQRSALAVERKKIETAQLVQFARGDIGTKEQQAQALKKLNDIIPDYIGVLTAQNIKTAEGTKIISAYVVELEKQATAELLVGRLAALNVKKFDDANKAKKALTNNLKAQRDLELEIASVEGRAKTDFNLTQLSALRGRLIDLQNESKAIVEGFSSQRSADNAQAELIRQEATKNQTAAGFWKDQAVKASNEKSKTEKQLAELEFNPSVAQVERRTGPAAANVAGAAGRPPAAAMAGINDETSKASVAAQELFANYQAIGTLISGTVSNAFGNMFNTLLTDGRLSIESLADSFKQLVVQLIQAVIQMAAMKAILSALNLGTGGAAGGIGGIANILGGLLRGGGFAQGGVSSGPQSGYLQLLHGTEYIIPANKFQNLIDNVQSMGGGGGVLTTRISGNDLQIIMNRAGNSGQFYR